MDEADLEFFDDWDQMDEEERSFEVGTSWTGVPNAQLTFDVEQDGVPGRLVVRNDDLETEAHKLMVSQSYEDVAFLAPGEVYALELVIETAVETESVNFFGQLPQEFVEDCLGPSSCDPSEFPAAALFVVDHGFALADFLNTVAGVFSSDVPGVSFIAVDEFGEPLFPVTGDVNSDGSIDNLDITPFVAALAAEDETAFLLAFPEGNYAAADIDMSGGPNNLDITPFIDLLAAAASNSAPIPEPASVMILLALIAMLRARCSRG